MESISFKLEVFEGPLDLLLSLISKHKLNICDIEISKLLEQYGSPALSTATSLAQLLCRPELDYEKLAPLDPGRKPLPADVIEQVQIEIRYEGYIKRQERQVREQERLEVKLIPEDIDYDDVPSLRIEARQHLKEFRPVSVGQASRISGVSPADISVLLVYLERNGSPSTGQ